jgi:hypothetical protein
MIISSSYKINSPFSSSGKVPFVKKTLTSEKNKIFIPSRIKDNYTSNSNYNSINFYDRSIIVKKISLSNIFNYNNSPKANNHPISLSFTEKDVLEDNSYMSNNRGNLYNNRVKKIKMATIIQSVFRRFLSNKKLFNNIHSGKRSHNHIKSIIYRKKLPLNKKNINYQSFDSFVNEKRSEKKFYNKIDKKFANQFFFTKVIIVNSSYEKAQISKIQKYWRNKKLNMQIGNYSRISNYQCQSEIVKKFNFNKKINLRKANYDSILFNSLHSMREEPENSKNDNKNNYNNKIQISKDKISVKTNNEIFHRFYLRNNYITRPQYIKLYNQNNPVKKEENEGIYQYEVNDINRSFKDKSFTLLHDKNKNGNYIQQLKYNTGKKINQIKSCSDIKKSNKSENNKGIKLDTDEKIKKNKEYKTINNNLKVWQKNKINCELYEDNINKYKQLKPNKNFICINSSKTEKYIKLDLESDIINKPDQSLMKKINGSSKKNYLKATNIKRAFINKNIINMEGKEPNINMERKLIMPKPNKQKSIK